MFEEHRRYFALGGVVSTDAKIVHDIFRFSDKIIIQYFRQMSMLFYNYMNINLSLSVAQNPIAIA